ncbi:c-type cytochrome biogenesis protein CcmI [Curvibacter sp. APW13]|uniref:c-type cytochrome biogenesis protein CcmI n=1 Tax=Curvibacter sp. APW13 TaxID=3077236 RepID=UPI0028DF18F0|nr:c-type cytochrome biogenesis protein CcmI [Curvibacter sp. APW13]MDT8991881.1 c-type cytochrome biogenesis protein CcmI [Curvibacter sp. APW13]
MTTFYLLALLLTALVTAWVLRPLLRTAPRTAVSSVQLNASIYRDQLEVLERDFTEGRIDAAELETARNELQLRLLEDTADTAAPAAAPSLASKRTAWVVALLLPLGGAAGYAWLGHPASVDPQAAQVAGRAQIEKMVANLAEKQRANPGNLQGWAMLGRSYKVLGRLDEAVQAYAKAGSFVEGNADLLVEYADVLALSRESNLQGQPTELLRKALALDPKHPMALLMMGVSAYQRENYREAIALWERLLAELEPGSEDAQQVESNISQARERLGKPAKKQP